MSPAMPPDARLTLANASAMGTAAGAPAAMNVGPPPAPAAPPPGAPPAGGPPARPAVDTHAGEVSVGTHQSANPFKRGNPPHGMSQ